MSDSSFLWNRFCGLVILLLWYIPADAQTVNYVLNPGMENEYRCPPAHSQFNYASPWYTPSFASTDLFCDCKTSSYAGVGVPENLGGYQVPADGKCYGGIVVYNDGIKNYAEYMAVPLSEPLKQGTTYYVSFYYSLADYSMYRIDFLGVWFGKKQYKISSFNRMNEKPACVNKEVLSQDTINWHLFSASFVAKGGETHMMIGCPMPSNPSQIRYKPLRVSSEDDPYDVLPVNTSYYFIDKVSVTDQPLQLEAEIVVRKQDKVTIIKDTITTTQIPENKIIKFNNLLFETDKYEIMPVSYIELNTLAEYLLKNPKLKIEIMGHTDSTGNEEHNIDLSQNRADAVKKYLFDQGISLSRISATGYGSSRPVDSNQTPSGRANNRRVEFIITKTE